MYSNPHLFPALISYAALLFPVCSVLKKAVEILLGKPRIAGSFTQGLDSDDLYRLYEQFKSNTDSQTVITIFTINDKEYNSTQLFEFITMQDQQCYVEQLLKYFIGVAARNQLVSITRSEYPLFEYETDQFLVG